MAQFKPSIEPASDNRSPLVEFSGILKEYLGEERSGNRGTYMVVKFNFTDVQVIESTEPYPFPIAVLELPYNKNRETRWDVFSISAKKVIGTNEIDLLVGKRQTWRYGSCMLRGPLYDDKGESIKENGREKWGSLPGNAWQIVSAEGFSANGSGGDLTQKLADLAKGKTDSEFYAALFQSSDLKNLSGFSEAVSMAQERRLLETLAAGGLISKTAEGKWA